MNPIRTFLDRLAGKSHSEQFAADTQAPAESDQTMRVDGGMATEDVDAEPRTQSPSKLARADPATAELNSEKEGITQLLRDNPDKLYDVSGTAQRVIDRSFDVVSQNEPMTELTGVEPSDVEGPLDCRAQLSGPACDTDDCTLKRLTETEADHIEVEIEKETPDGRTVPTILTAESITDDGPGIHPEEYEVITGKSEITQFNHASGLGLWLVYWIVQRSGGDIEFQSSESGSTVTIQLPHRSVT